MTPPKVEAPKPKEVRTPGAKVGEGEHKAVTVSFLQEFMASIRLRRLMLDAKPGEATKIGFDQLQNDLSSEDKGVKKTALARLDELWTAQDKAEQESRSLEVKDLVAKVHGITPERRARLEDLAKTIDASFDDLKNNGDTWSQDRLDLLNDELVIFASGIGVEGDPEQLEEMVMKVHLLKETARVREAQDSSFAEVSPIELYKKEYEAGDDGEKLKIKDVKGDEKQRMEVRLEKYKEHVRRELLPRDKAELGRLTEDELLGRIEEVSYWKAHKQSLYGKKWLGADNMHALQDSLGIVEAEYIVEFERRVAEKLKSEGVGTEYVRLATQKALKNRKPWGHSQYDFKKDVPAGKTAYEVIEAEVKDDSKKLEKESAKRSKVVVSGREGSMAGTIERGEDEPQFKSVEEATEAANELKGNVAKVDKLFKKFGVRDTEHLQELMERWQEPGGRDEVLDLAKSKGLTGKELTDFGNYFDSIAGQDGMGRFTGVQAELFKLSKEAQRTGNYAKYMIKLQAYIDRVGLREASSDFQFAIIMRQAKDDFSKINPDAGGKFDLWQESQFLPGITSVDEKTFFGMIPRVVTQARMQYELEDKYSNWLAMQVDGKEGKKALSVASFYQMLQDGTNARRMLGAPINGNDGMILKLWAEHIWGEGVTLVEREDNKNLISHVILADGTKVTDIGVNYFNMEPNGVVDPNSTEKMNVGEFLDQSMWMAHYATKLWWYSGEWEQFARDFPGERLPQANKRLLAIGAAFRDYGLEYGKFDPGYVELAKAGVLLQDFRTYKANDVIVANIRHLLYDTKIDASDAEGEKVPIAKWKRGQEIGEGVFKAFQSKADITDEYKPLSSLRSVEEIRLMGRLGEFSTADARWEWYRQQQLKTGRKGLPTASEISALRSQPFENLRGNDEAWVIQAEEIDKLFDNLRVQRKIIDDLHLTSDELAPIMDKQTFIRTGNHRTKGGESVDEWLKNFEYSSVLNYSELRKGTDPLDYMKYSEAKAEAASLMTEVLNGTPTLEKIAELFTKMRSYMPPDQVVAWFEAFEKKRVQLRTFQFSKYDIAMTDVEEWWLKRNRGEFDKKDENGKIVRPEHPPESLIGYNPATFSLKDDRGDKWNVTGADGFRVTRNHKIRGNHMWDTRKVPPLTAAQLETEHRLYVGNRWLMKESSEEILEGAFGLGQAVNKFYKDRGWDSKSKFARFVKKYGSKGLMLLRQHPLFDDPVWAFWNILNELKEYGQEIAKETGKELAH